MLNKVWTSKLTKLNAAIKPFTGALLTTDQELRDQILSFWPANFAKWSVYDTGAAAVENVFDVLPDLLVSSLDFPGISGVNFIKMVKGENVYRKIPALLCLGREAFSPQLELEHSEIDDFILLPAPNDEFRTRLELGIMRSYRSMDANPLTRLPGNTSIIRYIQECIEHKSDFALAYCDLDFFKSFNDTYGFSRGDEVLMMTARIILNTVRQIAGENSFIGHVGGDDFVFAVPIELAEQTCKNVIKSFDEIILKFYDPEDRNRGGIVAYDRQGVMRDFPIMAISIAVVFNKNGSIKHYGEISQIVANLKKKAKQSPFSNYVMDRRGGIDLESSLASDSDDNEILDTLSNSINLEITAEDVNEFSSDNFADDLSGIIDEKVPGNSDPLI